MGTGGRRTIRALTLAALVCVAATAGSCPADGGPASSGRVPPPPSLVETRNPGIGQVVTNEQVLELPLNGRQLTQLVLSVLLPAGARVRSLEFLCVSLVLLGGTPILAALTQYALIGLHRFRIGDYRVYFERHELGVLVYRIMNKNTLKDFLYRSNLPIPEDQALQQNPKFWELIEAATRTAHQHPAPPVVEK